MLVQAQRLILGTLKVNSVILLVLIDSLITYQWQADIIRQVVTYILRADKSSSWSAVVDPIAIIMLLIP